MITVARKILLAELEHGYEPLARRTGLTEKTLRNLAHGRTTNPPISTVYALFDACGIPLDGWRMTNRKTLSGET